MRLNAGTCLFTCGVLLACAAAASADDVIMPSTEGDNFFEDRGKRPFCNAFTGCGKKRSVDPINPMASLVDLNAEPAVAELSRQILSEAKLWEAMQEARDELARRPRKIQSARALPLGKRRSVDPAEMDLVRRLQASSMRGTGPAGEGRDGPYF